MKLWLDDVREPPDATWRWVKTVEEATEFIATNPVSEASLDHDLGRDDRGELLTEGRALVLWMAEHNRWPSEAIAVHSANVVGAPYIEGVIERYGPFTRVGHSSRFVRADANS